MCNKAAMHNALLQSANEPVLLNEEDVCLAKLNSFFFLEFYLPNVVAHVK